MTCIIGLVENGKMYMGGDSLGASGLNGTQRKDAKVFRKEHFLFGYTSSYRMGQLLKFKLTTPEHPSDISDYEYMCTYMIDEIRKCLKDNGYTTIKNNEETIGTFLIGYRGQIYSIDSDLQVGMQYNNYCSVGCGSYYALGAMWAMYEQERSQGDIFSPYEKIIISLKAAEEFSCGVRRPFEILKLG